MDCIVLNPFAKLISTEALTPDQGPVAVHFWDFDSQFSEAEQDCLINHQTITHGGSSVE